VEVGMNFYAVLGVPRDADDETIRGAYRILARRYHPDRGAGSSAEKFRMVNEAYETLIDPGSRRSYDLSFQPATDQTPVRIEPTVAQSGPLYEEDPAVYGRFLSRVKSSAFQNSAGFEDAFARWLRSLDELFFDSEWPW
jgi:curved DNA-binding protein CbpA